MYCEQTKRSAQRSDNISHAICQSKIDHIRIQFRAKLCKLLYTFRNKNNLLKCENSTKRMTFACVQSCHVPFGFHHTLVVVYGLLLFYGPYYEHRNNVQNVDPLSSLVTYRRTVYLIDNHF